MSFAGKMLNRKSTSSKLLSPHFQADGKPAVSLNQLQLEARDLILAKLANGTYKLIDMDCPLCGSGRKQLLSEKDATGLPFETSLCLACDVVYASRRFADASLVSFYENENFKLDRGSECQSGFLFEGERGQGAHIADVLRTKGLLEELRDSLIVEIGCGPGGILAHFRDLGFETMGFDIDPTVVAYGRSRGLQLHHGDTDAACVMLGSKSLRAGLLIYSQALEHMTDPRAELEKAKSLMDKESLLFIGVPGLRNVGPHYRYDLLHYLQPAHLIHFERFTLSRLLGGLGFEEIFANEVIDSVFRIAASDAPPPVESPPSPIMPFLRAVERERSRIAAVKRVRSTVGGMIRAIFRVHKT